MKKVPTTQRSPLVIVLALMTVITSACAYDSDSPNRTVDQKYDLALHGFNYTDLYIYNYQVNGQGGSNLEVSTPSSAGGSTTCCVTVHSHTRFPFNVIVKWNRGNDNRWCEETVAVQGPLPADPQNFNVHFFPDGHIEATITSDFDKPKLILNRASYARRHPDSNHVEDERVARCHDGY